MLSRFRRLIAPESLESRQLLAAGWPDPGFGSSGTATYALDVFDDYAEAATLQADGRIVVAGSTTVGLPPTGM
jgi:hypothetical protein